MNKSIVSIVKGTDPERMITEALDLLGGLEALIKPKSTVVIKPNAGHPGPPETSVNVSPAFVAAVIKVLRTAQPREIILAESAAIGCDTRECLDISGIGKAAQEAGVDDIIDIKREKDLIKIPIRDARSDLNKVLLPRFMLEADHIVNLPIFKAHVSMVFTCALKNIKGVVQDKVHFQMHQTNLADAMMDLWSVIKADLTIADMIRPAEGFGPSTPLPTDFGCVVAGRDPVAVDATACRMTGLDLEKVTYFDSARERGIGNFEEDAIEIRGQRIEDVFKKLWLPYLEGLDAWPEYNIYAEGACSSCQGLLAFTMENLKAMGEYDKHAGASIVIGRKSRLPEGLKEGKDTIFIGDCLKKYRDHGVFAGGCPPGEPYAIFAIVDRKDYWEAAQGAEVRQKYEPHMKAFHEYMLELKKRSEEGGRTT
ncbi:MAG: DUF362 domain-containing protein [Deltaproteobacteria bacterium]|nr:DUF362 domain-containing protein [Deltaproteobacteria bacterium]